MPVALWQAVTPCRIPCTTPHSCWQRQLQADERRSDCCSASGLRRRGPNRSFCNGHLMQCTALVSLKTRCVQSFCMAQLDTLVLHNGLMCLRILVAFFLHAPSPDPLRRPPLLTELYCPRVRLPSFRALAPSLFSVPREEHPPPCVTTFCAEPAAPRRGREAYSPECILSSPFL